MEERSYRAGRLIGLRQALDIVRSWEGSNSNQGQIAVLEAVGSTLAAQIELIEPLPVEGNESASPNIDLTKVTPTPV